MVLLCKLLNKFLILVHFLQTLDIHVVQTDLFSLFNVLGISEHADLHLGAGNVGQFYGTTETLILLGIIVLQPDL